MIKKASDLEKKILDTQKSIKSTTSSSMVNSKKRQIEGYEKDKAKAVQDSANCTDKISKLREKRNAKNQQYQKALADEQKDMVHVDAVLKMISVMSGDDAYEKVVVTGRRPRKLNEYVKKSREQREAIGLAKGLLILGNNEEVVVASLMKAFSLTEADAKSYIAMADEEMKGVTA